MRNGVGATLPGLGKVRRAVLTVVSRFRPIQPASVNCKPRPAPTSG